MRLERGEDVNGRMSKVRDIVAGSSFLKQSKKDVEGATLQ